MKLILNHAEIDHMLEDKDGPVVALLTRLAVEGETISKRLAPVDTGRLKSSITHQVGADDKGPVAFVGSDVSYSIYQELGTKFQPGTPYLRPMLQVLKP